MDLSQLLAVPAPQPTNTYAPISHREIHEAILSEAKDNAFDVRDISVKTKNGKNCIVMYSLVDFHLMWILKLESASASRTVTTAR